MRIPAKASADAHARLRQGLRSSAWLLSAVWSAPGLAQTPPPGPPLPAQAAPAPTQAPPPPAPIQAPPSPFTGQPSPFTGQPSPSLPAYSNEPPPRVVYVVPPPAAAAQPVVEGSSKPPRVLPLAVFRFGYGAHGAGDLDFRAQCVGSCPLSLRNDSVSVSERTRALLGFDLMFGPEPVSLGVGWWFTTGTTLEADRSSFSTRSIGWELMTPFMLGGVVRLTDAIAIRAGAFGGPEFLFADGRSAQGRDGEAYEKLCDDLGRQVSDCDVSFATRLAWTYGLHAGPVFRTSRLSTIGAELMLQRVDFELFDVVAEGSSWRAQQVYDYAAWRVWIMLTVGVGK